MNLKDLKAGAVRRRGTTIAAAALSVALVSPFAQPVMAGAQEGGGQHLLPKLLT